MRGPVSSAAAFQLAGEFHFFLMTITGMAFLGSNAAGVPLACWAGVAGALFVCWQYVLSRNVRGRAGERRL